MDKSEVSLDFNVKVPNYAKTPEEINRYREEIIKEIHELAKKENIEVQNVTHTENFGLGEVLLVLQIAGAAAALFCDRVVPVIRRKYPGFPQCSK